MITKEMSTKQNPSSKNEELSIKVTRIRRNSINPLPNKKETLNLYREDTLPNLSEQDLKILLKAKDSQDSPQTQNSFIKEISDFEETEETSLLFESLDEGVIKKLESIKAKYTLPTVIIEEEAVESGTSTLINSGRREGKEFVAPKDFFESFEDYGKNEDCGKNEDFKTKGERRKKKGEVVERFRRVLEERGGNKLIFFLEKKIFAFFLDFFLF